MSSSYKICLTFEAQRHVIEISNTTTLQEVYDIAYHHFVDAPQTKKKPKSTTTTANIEFKVGFPPKPLSCTTAALQTTLAQSIFHKNERVVVSKSSPFNNASKGMVMNQPNKNQKQKTTTKRNKKSNNSDKDDDDNEDSNNGSNNNTGTSSTRRRSTQRSAAKVASDNFKDVIRAQDALLRKEGSSSKRKRTTNTTSSPSKKATAAAAAARAEAANRRRLAQMPGRRLGDGANVNVNVNTSSSSNTTAPRTKQTRPRTNHPKISSQDDVATTLMDALSSSSGGGGKVGSILRTAMKNAVSQAYETNRANARVAAVQAGTFQISSSKTHQPQNNNNDSNKHTGAWTVTFPKGIEGRGTFEEVVDAIPLEALCAVIRGIYHTTNDSDGDGKESLRPQMLAQLSPRVFWSLVQQTETRIVNNNNNDKKDTSILITKISSIEDCYQIILPDLDWSYLNARTKTLSAKAKENLRQAQQEQQQDTSTTTNLEAAEQAIHDVEHAMEQLYQYDSKQRHERVANAALARFSKNTTTTTSSMKQEDNQQRGNTQGDSFSSSIKWKLITPVEEDQDELKECICSSSITRLSQEQINQVILTLMKDCSIYNWRQLANTKNATDIVDLLKNNATTKMILNSEMVESWIDYAQSQSVEEVIVEVCDGRIDVVEIMRDQARTGTPKDLCNWRQIPEMLWEECGFHNHNHTTKKLTTTARKDPTSDITKKENAATTTTSEVSLDDIATWCQRAYQILQEQDEYEWLHWYTTSVTS